MSAKDPEEMSPVRPQKGRSPNYPAFPLAEAISKADALWEHEKTSSVAAALACEHWGVKMTSSSGMRCLSTMLAFGLVEDEGKGEAKRVKLTDRGRLLVRHPDRHSPERSDGYRKLLQDAALAPRMHAEMWEAYKTDGWPSDKNLAWTLEETHGFHDQAIAAFIGELKATFELAGLHPGAKVDEDAASADDTGKSTSEAPSNQPLAAFKPMGNQRDQLDQSKSLPLPLISGGTAVLQLPYLLSDEDFDWLKMMLDKLKKGIVIPPPVDGA